MQNRLTDQEKAELVFGLHDDTLQPWNLNQARALAKLEGITLTEDHLDVIRYIRMTFEKHGPVKHARTLTQALDAKFGYRGGLKYLYTLFPGGPVTQGCKLAGVTKPHDSTDSSFGSRR